MRGLRLIAVVVSKLINSSGGNMIMQSPWTKSTHVGPACPLLSKSKGFVRLAWTWKRRLERAEGRRRRHAELVVGKDRPLLLEHQVCMCTCSVLSPREPTRVCIDTHHQSNYSISNVKFHFILACLNSQSKSCMELYYVGSGCNIYTRF